MISSMRFVSISRLQEQDHAHLHSQQSSLRLLSDMLWARPLTCSPRQLQSPKRCPTTPATSPLRPRLTRTAASTSYARQLPLALPIALSLPKFPTTDLAANVSLNRPQTQSYTIASGILNLLRNAETEPISHPPSPPQHDHTESPITHKGEAQ